MKMEATGQLERATRPSVQMKHQAERGILGKAGAVRRRLQKKAQSMGLLDADEGLGSVGPNDGFDGLEFEAPDQDGYQSPDET
ncbi:unnamed protein product [Linum trigynum]|uniref:Uncharacterized protein n=1 Tax=Linum trigynum TaxID=586398 RepID=A0AAV2CFT1_9ROSI